MGDYAVVDGSRAPIVHVQVVGEPTDASFEEYLEDVNSAFERLERFGLVFNTGSLGALPPRYRDRLSHWQNETREQFEGRFLCACFVIESMVIRGALSAIFWLSKPYYKVHVAGTEEAAWQWTREQLRQAGVDVS